MNVSIAYGRQQLRLDVPDGALIYSPTFPAAAAAPGELVLGAVRRPVAGPALAEMIRARQPRSVVVVVSDITRPVPYRSFLGGVLAEIEAAGVARQGITILVATGMHRPSNEAERRKMFGAAICEAYAIVDHRASEKDELVAIEGQSRSGRPVELNRRFVEADFRLITGLVEPHFMAGFSGGRKSVCPGLCSLDTVRAFHGHDFLIHPASVSGILEGNPLHDESLSIARAAGVDFCLNVIVNPEHGLVDAYAGELEASHAAACGVVRRHACPTVERECDVVLTSSGGYPLDATFYQCVKGLVSCLPVVKSGGIVLAAGQCCEGLGSPEYRTLMHKYAGRRDEFLREIEGRDEVEKDQWELQMQFRAVDHVGDQNLVFVTNGLPSEDIEHLSLRSIDARGRDVEQEVQRLLDGFLRGGCSLAAIPDGPYCAPVRA